MQEFEIECDCVKECDLGFLLGSCIETFYKFVQNLKQVRMSSKEESTSTQTKIVDLHQTIF
jgi:hypothetical protein